MGFCSANRLSMQICFASSGQNKIESNALTRSELGPPIALRIVGGNDHLDKLTLCLCSLRCDDEGPCAPQSTLITDLRAILPRRVGGKNSIA
jgi:hypothetical protein